MEYLLEIGSILVLSVLFGEVASRFKLPRLIGYLTGGFILGPSVLDYLDIDFLNSSRFLKHFSLAYIMFVIGTKIKGERVINLGRGLLWIAMFEITATILLTTTAFSFFFGNPLYALLIGIVAATTAPAATAMITEEYHSEGPFTDSILFIVGVDNLVALILFNLIAPIVLKTSDIFHISQTVFMLIISILLGIVMGIAVSYSESGTSEKNSGALFLISFGIFFIGLGITSLINGYYLLYALFMGITISNASVKNQDALNELFYIKTPIYILFFFIAGASLHIKTISEMRWAVLVYVLFRTAGKLAGAYIGARKGRLEDTFRKYAGTGLLTHAGLATGLAIYIGDSAVEGGHRIMNTILTGTIIFEIFGPLFLKTSLVKTGEVKVIHIMKKGMEPIFDSRLHSVLLELTKAFGLKSLVKYREPGEVKIKHIMRKKFTTLSPTDHIQEIVKAFEKTHANALPVISENNIFHGIIHLNELEHLFVNDVTEKLIVAEDLVIQCTKLSPEDELLHALKIMQKEGLDCLPVVNEDVFLGIVTRKDIVTGMA